MMAFLPGFWPVMSAQAVIGGVSSIFIPAICAISLGMVGHRHFDRRQGRNQTLNSAGNVIAALAMGLLGYYVSDRSIFFFVVVSAVPALLSLLAINPRAIDYGQARGAGGTAVSDPAGISSLLKDRPLVMFLICAVMFHFANAAMLPLLGQKLARGQERTPMAFMSACVVTTQVVVALLSSWAGTKAGRWGRKPLLLAAFAALPIRGVLYTLTANTGSLIAVQVLDGVAVGIFGVVSVLVIADLTHGSGRFNLTVGAIGTATGIGASLSQSIAGSVAHGLGFDAGFLFLAAVAAAALAFLYFFVPETGFRSHQTFQS
jgi:predicted MFS family arabinose efflux permease